MTGTLTIFTPTFNRAHTLPRLYRSLCAQTKHDFKWLVVDDGSTDGTEALVKQWQRQGIIPIQYIYKKNGGLYTAYNTAYSVIDTELNVCVDSDDWMPDNAVAIILEQWQKYGNDNYAGLLGLDCFADGTPIGGCFPDSLRVSHFLDLYIRNIHRGDTKPVYRTELTRRFAPMTGFAGERFFNPVYIALQIDNIKPMLIVNKNLCFVEYQQCDSMSRNIFRQYVDSPRSFCKQRALEMTHSRSTLRNSLRVATHYVATALLSGDSRLLWQSPRKLLTAMVFPVGVALWAYIKIKARQ